MSPKVTCSVSLENYHPYLPLQKIPKIPKIECIHSGLSRNAKSHFGCLGPLGINDDQPQLMSVSNHNHCPTYLANTLVTPC
jgi:hypothetical protein